MVLMAFVILTTLTFVGCKKEDMANGSPANGSTYSRTMPPPYINGFMTVEMTNLSDSKLGEVNVEIIGLVAHYTDAKNLGYKTLPVRAGIYNLQEIKNYLAKSIMNPAIMAVGEIDQLRVLLGTHNTVVTGDKFVRHVYPLVLADRNNVVNIEINSKIEPSKTLGILLNFNASASVDLENEGLYILEPVITKASFPIIRKDREVISTE